MSVMTVTDATFAAAVLGVDEPVLLDVWAEWCAPCTALVPVMERLATAYEGRVRVATLDADANLETVTRYDVRALPSLLLFDRGVLAERLTGAQPLGALAALLDGQLAHRAVGAPPVSAPPPTLAAPRADATATAEAEALLTSASPLVLFKHSATCSISIGVKRAYDAFVHAHPHVATRVVVVQQERPLSNAIASLTQVRHESPQALVVREGRVVWQASHHRITAEALAHAVADGSAPDR